MARSERPAPRPTGLFLRYCAACNTTQAVAERGRCATCGGEYPIVEAHALVEALGMGVTPAVRAAEVRRLTALDKP